MSNKTPPPMTKKEFVKLLEEVLKEKKEKTNLKLVPPYDLVYDKCILGYEISQAKEKYEESITFKTSDGDLKKIEAHGHLKYVLKSLISSYGIDAVVDTLKGLNI